MLELLFEETFELTFVPDDIPLEIVELRFALEISELLVELRFELDTPEETLLEVPELWFELRFVPEETFVLTFAPELTAELFVDETPLEIVEL